MKAPLDPRIPVLSRRHFIGLSGLGVLGYAFRAQSAPLRQSLHGIRYNDPLQPLVFKVRRAWDLLNMEVELINFMPVRQRGWPGGPTGTPAASPAPADPNKFVDEFGFHIASYSRPGYVVLRFGGQHIAEQAIWDRPVIPPGGKKAEAPFPRYFLTPNEDIEFLRRERFAEDDKSGVKPKPGYPGGLAGAWLAGHSQVVFEIPQRHTPLPFDLDELLERCLMFGKLRVHPRLMEEEPPKDFFTGSPHDSLRLDAPYLGQHDVTAPYTRIEFPSLLYISPYDNARWKLRPTSWGNRAELWSLDLERPDAGAAAGRPRELKRKGHLFAFDTETLPGRWPNEENPVKNETRKYANKETPKTSLYMATRQLLVGQMMADNGDITARDFRLTTLGATADLHYKPLLPPRLKDPTKKGGVSKQGDTLDGEPPKPGEEHKPENDTTLASGEKKPPGFLTEWIHKTEIGRDYYVKEAFAGWWFPLQLPAESVTITERLFCADLSPEDLQKTDPLLERVSNMEGNLVAFLVARKFGVVKERVRDFGPAESDDFDEVSSRISRGNSVYRKVEILVDRTPVLSNQPTGAIAGDIGKVVMDRMEAGEDGIFVTGGSGKDAGREVFWPRVAVPAGANGKGRRTSVYRFPVRLTLHDGTVKETDMPMLFCHDLNDGCAYYMAAHKELKEVAVNAKVPLAPPQHAGAVNGGEIAVEDQQQMLAVLKEWNLLHPAFEALVPPGKTDEQPAKAALFTETAARTVSTLLGGMRETLFDHVSSFRPHLLAWLNAVASQSLPEGKTRQEKLTLFLIKADSFTGFRETDAVAEAMASSIVRTIAWGRDAHRGADVSHSAKRFAAFVEQIKSLGVDECESKAGWFIDLFKKQLDLARYPELAARKDDFVTVGKTLENAPTANKIDYLEQRLPALQVAWVSTMGKTWQRMQWDEWFAELFIGLDRKEQKSPPWMLTAASLIQKRHLQFLMQGKKLGDFTAVFPNPALRSDLIKRAFNPVASLDPPAAKDSKGATAEKSGAKCVYSVPAELTGSFESFFDELQGALLIEGTTALHRLKAAIEESLPNEIFLRQKVQQLAEDFNALTADGPKGRAQVKEELSQIFSECSLNLRHLAVHADEGKRRVRTFMLSASSSLEKVAEPLRKAETAIEDVIKSTRLTFPKGNEEREILKLVLSSPPAETLGHFKNLLRETGGRITAEIEDALLDLNDLVLNSVQQLEELRGRVDRYLVDQPAGLFKSAAELATVLTLTDKHRLLREQILMEVSKAIAPWRGMLLKCLRSATESFKKEVEGTRLGTLLLDNEKGVVLSVRLGARVTDLLSRVRADVDPGSMNEIQKAIFTKEIVITRDLVRSRIAVSSQVSEAIELLKKHGAPLDAGLKAEIDALSKAIENEKKSIAEKAWENCDGLEQFLLELLSLERKDLITVCRKLLEQCGAALATGAAADIEKKLEATWNEMTPAIKELQMKFGQTLGTWADWENKAEGAKADIQNKLKGVANDLKNELEKRAGFLEGAGLNLIQKGRIALACPSMLKSFRDQSTKAVYHVEEMVMGMAKENGQQLLEDLRTSVGFPQLQNMKVRVPDIDAPQIIKNTAAYLEGGLRGASTKLEGELKGAAKEAAGAFAEIVGAQASTIARDSGMADAVSSIQMLSRDVGGMAKDFKDKVGNLKTEADAALKDLVAKGDEYKKAIESGIQAEIDNAKDKIKDVRNEIESRLDKAKADLEAEAGKFLPEGMGKLFDVLPMKDILAVIGSPDKAPQMLASRLPDRVERNYNWENEIKQFSLPGGLLRFDPRSAEGTKPKLKVTNQIILWVPKPGQPVRPPDYSTKGQIGGFSLTLAGMLQLHFQSVCFTARNGKCDFDVKLGRTPKGPGKDSPPGTAVVAGNANSSTQDEKDQGEFMSFLGPLEIVDTIRQKLASFINGKNGPLVSIEGERIYAGYSFMVPPIAFGAVCVENISLSVQLSLPLKAGALTFLFKLCERMQPFRVAVSGFTGGGYLGVQVSPDRKLCYVEGAAEFGGSLSFNVGVAQGEIYLMAGIYFKMEQAGVIFSGYVRAGGCVSVLGFINVTVMFFLALYYEKRAKQTVFRGECTLSVRVSMGFLKKTVRIQMKREFQGAKSESQDEPPEPQTTYLSTGKDRAMASTDLLSKFLLLAVTQVNVEPGKPKEESRPVIPTRFEDTFDTRKKEGSLKGKFDSSGWSQYYSCFDRDS